MTTGHHKNSYNKLVFIVQNCGGRPDGDDADQRPAGEAQVPAPHHQQLRTVQQAPQVVPLTRLQQCNQGQSTHYPAAHKGRGLGANTRYRIF
jgi:hypothetical protein